MIVCDGNLSKSPGLSVRRAFTLMELMLVVIILGLLITIAVPGIATMFNGARRASSLAIVSTLEKACIAFSDDFREFPPSHQAGALDKWTGAQLLPLFLTGYAPDKNGNGVVGGDLPSVGDQRSSLFYPFVTNKANDSNSFDKDDGADGYGFRLSRAGKKYGPYLGAEDIEAAKMAPDDRAAFIDTFGNPIFYYVWDNGYDKSDNHVTDGLAGPLSTDDDYAEDSAGQYLRKDFFLATAGPDRRFVSFADSPTTDDITNIVPEE